MSWRMTWADAAIPFAISFVQVFFALAIPESATVFIFWFACVTGIGCLSYWHAVTNIRSKHSQALFAEHFGFEGDKIHKRIEKYFGDCLRTLIGCTLCAGVIYILCATGFLARAPNLDLAVVTIFIAIVIVMHFADDSSVRMKDYYNDWAREPK